MTKMRYVYRCIKGDYITATSLGVARRWSGKRNDPNGPDASRTAKSGKEPFENMVGEFPIGEIHEFKIVLGKKVN